MSMNEYIELRVQTPDAQTKALLNLAKADGAMRHHEDIIKGLREYYDRNNKTEPGNTISDWLLGFRAAVTILEDAYKGEK